MNEAAAVLISVLPRIRTRNCRFRIYPTRLSLCNCFQILRCAAGAPLPAYKPLSQARLYST